MYTCGGSRLGSLHLENYMRVHTSCLFSEVSTVMGIGFDNHMRLTNMCGVDYNRFPEYSIVTACDEIPKIGVCLCGCGISVKEGKRYVLRHNLRCSKVGSNNPMFGKHHSEETKSKIGISNSIALKGRYLAEEHKANIGIALKGQQKSEKHKASLRISHIGQVSPMKGKHHTSKTKDRCREASIKRLLEHPEKHPNYILAKNGGLSKPQMRLFEIVKAEVGEIEVFLNYGVKTKTCRSKIRKSIRFIDVAIPSLRLGFEYDGKYFHPKIDEQRDKELIERGWTIAHIDERGLKYIA